MDATALISMSQERSGRAEHLWRFMRKKTSYTEHFPLLRDGQAVGR